MSAKEKIHYPSDFAIGGAQKLPFSAAIRAGDFLYLSGVTAVDRFGRQPGGGIDAETRLVLDSIKSILESLGCGMEDVIKTTCFLDDPRDFMNFNRVFAEYFPTNPPTRTTVRAQLMMEGKVEIEVVAYKPLDESHVISQRTPG
jgi:reactive intermediate/imine deaminase